jgi:hypothetical protein
MIDQQRSLRYAAVIAFDETDADVLIEVIHPIQFLTEQDARTFGHHAYLDLCINRVGETITLTLCEDGKDPIQLSRSQVRIRLVPPNDARIPLDLSDPDQLKIILDAMGDMSSPYCISEDDLIPVDWSFEKLSEVIRCPVRFSSTAYEVEELTL